MRAAGNGAEQGTGLNGEVIHSPLCRAARELRGTNSHLRRRQLVRGARGLFGGCAVAAGVVLLSPEEQRGVKRALVPPVGFFRGYGMFVAVPLRAQQPSLCLTCRAVVLSAPRKAVLGDTENNAGLLGSAGSAMWWEVRAR